MTCASYTTQAKGFPFYFNILLLHPPRLPRIIVAFVIASLRECSDNASHNGHGCCQQEHLQDESTANRSADDNCATTIAPATHPKRRESKRREPKRTPEAAATVIVVLHLPACTRQL
jgi:hypothetical protein